MGIWKEGKREGHGELVHKNHRFVGKFKEDKVDSKVVIFNVLIFVTMGEYMLVVFISVISVVIIVWLSLSCYSSITCWLGVG